MIAKQRYRLAIVQLDSRADKSVNLAIVSQYLDQAAEAGANLISLPEVFNEILEEGSDSEDLSGPSVRLLRDKAKQHGVYLHGGSLLLNHAGKPTNTTLLIDDAGEIVARYDKLHLFDVLLPDGSTRGESDWVSPGNQVVTAQTPLGKLGLSICYDLRFPELYRLLTLAGAEVLFVPANFTMLTGKDHWEALLRARAIENGCYVVAAAQMGRKKVNEDSFGSGMIIDPWGVVIARSPNYPGVTLAEIDLDYVSQVRQLIPALANRRSDIYHLD